MSKGLSEVQERILGCLQTRGESTCHQLVPLVGATASIVYQGLYRLQEKGFAVSHARGKWTAVHQAALAPTDRTASFGIVSVPPVGAALEAHAQISSKFTAVQPSDGVPYLEASGIITREQAEHARHIIVHRNVLDKSAEALPDAVESEPIEKLDRTALSSFTRADLDTLIDRLLDAKTGSSYADLECQIAAKHLDQAVECLEGRKGRPMKAIHLDVPRQHPFPRSKFRSDD